MSAPAHERFELRTGASIWDDGRPTPAERDVVDWLLTTTRSNRKTLDLTRPVDPEVVEECLRIALQAPVAHNEQRWHWCVVEEEAKRKAVADVYVEAWEAATKAERRKVRKFRSADQTAASTQDSAHWLAEHLHEVPLLVIPCLVGPRPDDQRLVAEWNRTMRLGGVPEPAAAPLEASYWGSIYPAVWSFQLALRSRGLGSVVTVMHLTDHQRVADILGLPQNVGQAGMLPVAYLNKTAFKQGKRAPLETRMSWNSWGRSRS